MRTVMRTRYLKLNVSEDLEEKMVFIGGPRQVGKTTFSVDFLSHQDQSDPGYFNWDVGEDRQKILQTPFQPTSKMVFDEIHKYARWRGFIKGLYDKYQRKTKIIVTGSARLDHYRKGGDSLLGRYHCYRMHPFSLGELDKDFKRTTTESLLKLGGFPEPFLGGSETKRNRWALERKSRVIREDIRDLENIREISLIELLSTALPGRVGSILSRKNLQKDLQVSFESIERWLSILEKMYFCFRISPYGSPKIRAVKKEQKLYCWDWTDVSDGGARKENLVASQLLKYCHFIEDAKGDEMELRFVRDTDKREIDFVVLRNKSPEFAVECKSGEKQVSKHIEYFRQRTKIKKFYQVHFDKLEYGNAELTAHVLPFERFCQLLKLP